MCYFVRLPDYVIGCFGKFVFGIGYVGLFLRFGYLIILKLVLNKANKMEYNLEWQN